MPDLVEEFIKDVEQLCQEKFGMTIDEYFSSRHGNNPSNEVSMASENMGSSLTQHAAVARSENSPLILKNKSQRNL